MQIAEDPLSQLAAANWAATPGDGAKLPAFKPALVVDIYRKHLGGGSDKPPSLKRVMLLELSQYMELYLWPNFDAAKSSYEHIMSVLLLINEKFRENVPAWGIFSADKVPTEPHPSSVVLVLRPMGRRTGIACGGGSAVRSLAALLLAVCPVQYTLNCVSNVAESPTLDLRTVSDTIV